MRAPKYATVQACRSGCGGRSRKTKGRIQSHEAELRSIRDSISAELVITEGNLPRDSYARLFMLKEQVESMIEIAAEPVADGMQEFKDEHLRRYVKYAEAAFDLWVYQ